MENTLPTYSELELENSRLKKENLELKNEIEKYKTKYELNKDKKRNKDITSLAGN